MQFGFAILVHYPPTSHIYHYYNIYTPTFQAKYSPKTAVLGFYIG